MRLDEKAQDFIISNYEKMTIQELKIDLEAKHKYVLSYKSLFKQIKYMVDSHRMPKVIYNTYSKMFNSYGIISTDEVYKKDFWMSYRTFYLETNPSFLNRLVNLFKVLLVFAFTMFIVLIITFHLLVFTSIRQSQKTLPKP